MPSQIVVVLPEWQALIDVCVRAHAVGACVMGGARTHSSEGFTVAEAPD